LVVEIRQKLEEQKSALQVLEVAGGFQMATRPVYGELVRKLFAERMTMRLSTAAHETLAIIAYKQPLTRAEIEDIRGVEVIASLETLLEKRLVKVVGRKESVGRPLLYGTTADFMRHFGLSSLEELPPIDDFQAPETPGVPAADGVVEPSSTTAEAPAPMTDNALPEVGPVSADAIPEGAQGDGTSVPTQDEGAEAPSEPAAPIWPSDESEGEAAPSEPPAPMTADASPEGGQGDGAAAPSEKSPEQ